MGTKQLAFNSYTFTDISTGFFDKAREEFAEHEDRMEFRSLDIRRNPKEQGFKPHSYHMILASNVLHATPKLEETMTNARSLLKPGGQMVILELTHREHSRLGFIFGLFPDWWAGVDEGRTLEPFVSFDRWEEILKRVGFSGIDYRTLDRDSTLFPNSVFCTHAVNEKTLRLSEPLSAPLKDSYPQIVVVGGGSPRTSCILDGLRKALPHRQFGIVKRLQDIHESEFEPKSTFIVLSELDDELFSGLDEDKFEAVKSIFFYANHLLWLTENAWVKHPHQAMAIGLLRSVRLEHVDVHTQVLDVDHAENLDTKFLAEQLLRLEDGSNRQEDGIMWTEEPEVYLSQNRVLVPRLKHAILRNNRLNSSRRPILAVVNLDESPVSFYQTNDDAYLECNDSFSPLQAADATRINIRVHYALAKAIRVGNLGYFYLVQGTVPGSGKAVVALSESNASRVEVPGSRVFALGDSRSLDNCALVPIAADLMAETLLSGTAPGMSVLFFEPPQFCIEAVARRAKSMGALVKFASVQPPPQSGAELWIRLHKKETERGLANALPANLLAFYDFSSDQSPVGLGRRLASCLPPSCLIYRTEHLAQELAASISVEEGHGAVQISHVERAVTAASDLAFPTAASVITANQLTTLELPYDASTVIDWKADYILSARVRPIDSEKLFVDDKTYLLVGLAGDLGRSICRWMIMHGARHVVLSSRYPQIDPRWIDDVTKLGGNVMALPM